MYPYPNERMLVLGRAKIASMIDNLQYQREDWTNDDAFDRYCDVVRTAYVWMGRGNQIMCDVVYSSDGRLWAESITVPILEAALSELPLELPTISNVNPTTWKAEW
jgi:hypothetical protein